MAISVNMKYVRLDLFLCVCHLEGKCVEKVVEYILKIAKFVAVGAFEKNKLLG